MLRVTGPAEPTLHDWFAALEKRHLRDLSFAEVRRAVQALSALYVERRGQASPAGAFRGAGKRAAFALFYGPLHFAVTREIVRRVGAGDPAPARIHDLGCGSGAAGAAWALECGGRAFLRGVDLHPWAVEEANWSWSRLSLAGRARLGRMERERLPGAGGAVLLAYAVNELAQASREALLQQLVDAALGGTRVLVVEPISRRVVPWWDDWAAAFEAAGGRDDRWRFEVDLPERWRLFDRAAGLDHRELTARSLYL